MSSRLVVGDWVVARSEGSLEIEYALFAASDVLLAAQFTGFGVREQGYLTTASIARERLEEMGATTDLARAALRALGPREGVAKSASIARVAGKLAACEAFQGGTYDAHERRYAGTWLHLDAVARACEMENAAFAMQLVHLAAVVADVPDDTPVRLRTAADQTKANQRTWRRVSVASLADLPHALAKIPRPLEVRVAENEADVNAEATSDLRARAPLSRERARLEAIASALGTFEAHESERHMATARAWLASGDLAYARYTARRVTEDPKASSGARVAADELLDSTARTNESMHPPPVAPPAIEAVNERPRQPSPSSRAAPEVVETMSTPEGDDTRAKMTQLARELARDYRLAYGTTLKTDPVAIEAMQRHLRRRFGEAKRDEHKARMLDAEITRHGALLSEILARTLGARWIETQGEDPGGWSMMVPPATRVWPIGRVHRFLQQASRESDLVAFYFELERAARP